LPLTNKLVFSFIAIYSLFFLEYTGSLVYLGSSDKLFIPRTLNTEVKVLSFKINTIPNLYISSGQ